MTRTIKFRLWQEDEAKMVFPTIFSFPITDELKYKNYMQFTGLCDKNGKEIYEEDILKWTDPSFKELKKEYKLLKVPDITNISPMGKQDEKYLEIIGNIHENPELLTNVK